MQRITISGNIGKDGQLKQVRDQSVLSFTVAVKQGRGDNTSTNWYRVQMWGKRAEYMVEKALKGVRVYAVGEFTIGSWEGKPQYEVKAEDIEFMGGSTVKPQEQRTSAPQSSPAYEDDLDDSIPFD